MIAHVCVPLFTLAQMLGNPSITHPRLIVSLFVNDEQKIDFNSIKNIKSIARDISLELFTHGIFNKVEE